MWKQIERSAILRTLNFLRVKHPHRRRYNFIYPAGIVLITLGLIFWGPADLAKVDLTKTFKPIYDMLFILFPFYLASLAAVSTFSGPVGFDNSFKMGTPVTLLISHRGGAKEINVSPRYFLSLLFGYCTVATLFLIVALTVEATIDPALFFQNLYVVLVIKTAFLSSITFVVSQLAIFSMLAVYYLADLIHRIDARED